MNDDIAMDGERVASSTSRNFEGRGVPWVRVAKSLSASDIADQPIVGYPKHARPILHEALWSGFREIGAQPSIVCQIMDKSTLLQFVAHGLGIALVPAWVQNIAPRGVILVPLETCDYQIELYVAFRKSGNSDTVEGFVEAVRRDPASTMVFDQ